MWALVELATIATTTTKEKRLPWRRQATKQPVLLDAEAIHRANPRTFSIPRRIVRDSLRSGDRVKLLFQVDPPKDWAGSERMWVEVISTRNGEYVGRLANTPVALSSLKLGDRVTFRAEHVAGREVQPGDRLDTDLAAFAVVSRRVWEEDAWPARLERDAIPDPQFSGWIVFAGDESGEFKADLDNFVPVAQGTLCDRFRVLDSGLEGPIGTTMIWNDQAAEYQVEQAPPQTRP